MKNYIFIFKGHMRKLIALAIFIALSSILSIVITYIGGMYIDIIAEATSVDIIYLICIFIVVISSLNLIIRFLTSLIKNVIIENMIFDFKYYILEHLKGISTVEYKKFNAAYLAKRIEADSRQISQFFVNNYMTAIVTFFEIIVIFFIVIRINFITGLIMVIVSPIYYFVYTKFKQPIFDKNLIAKEKSDEFFQAYTYQLEYLEDIVIESDFEKENKLLRDKFYTFKSRYKDFLIINNKLTFTQGFIVLGMHSTIYLVGGISVINGYTTIGRLSILIAYFIQVLGNINYYNELARTYQLTKSSIHRIDKLVDIPLVKEGNGRINDITSIHANVNYLIGEKLILNNIRVYATKGEIVGVVGRNGTGKTSLLKLLMGIIKLEDDDLNSSIIFNGCYNINDLDTLYLRKEFFSYTSQKIRFRDITMKEVFNEIMVYDDCQDFIRNFKENGFPLTTEIENFIICNWDVNMDNLSGGDKQLVTIIRNVAKKSSVMIFDEPTSNLDTNRIEWFIELVTLLKENRIIFVITHDIHVYSLFDQIINLEA